MNLIPRDPWLDVDRIFDNFLPLPLTLKRNGDDANFFRPRVDVVEKEDHYEIIAELPGVQKNDINVQLEEGVLTIEAQVAEEKTSEKDKVICKERRTGYFSRSFNIGTNVTADDISASFDNGLLKLTAPKAKPVAEEKRRIAIK
ncbi:Hsp20/alpha crystallin family protein [Shewanella sp. AS16]|uniref:Hsp20/alpha crystallin family protein n=1 Tax=Shewanella sp. AS16 TaxID=2907625 RepID=UPI001F17FE55|nr:Hsp20/alpha crystallin family protein [Shewanella sp. AS16]MCE9687716.1 Hsp20/alpha crystallin family protein [Shewanella sp. AS16]